MTITLYGAPPFDNDQVPPQVWPYYPPPPVVVRLAPCPKCMRHIVGETLCPWCTISPQDKRITKLKDGIAQAISLLRELLPVCKTRKMRLALEAVIRVLNKALDP